MMDQPPLRKAAFSALRGRPREVALQVLYQDDLNPGISPQVGEDLIDQRLSLNEFLTFGSDELLEETDDEAPAATPPGLQQFNRGELLEFAREIIRGFHADELRTLSRMELAQLVRDDAVEFARNLVAGVRRGREELDGRIQAVAENWSLTRMAATDRNILRLGAFELLQSTTPDRVAIDEAVELAKRFGSAQSGPFVNGILNRLMQQKGA